MIKSLYTAATGMDAQQIRISVISNNIANVTTSGFKQSGTVFQDLLYQNIASAGTESAAGVISPAGLQVGSGVKVISTPSVHSQGLLEQTSRALDVAIEGEGFFQVSLPSGETSYSRLGSLAINADGQLVTQAGFPIEPSISGLSGATELRIGSDGTITGYSPGSNDVTSFGQITIATFPNASGLKAIGQTMFQETAASGSPTTSTPGTGGAGTLSQGFLEGSNVNIADELVKMILAQRSFELNSKVIRTSDDMMAAANQLR
jgi:flagellar basal-body rod protein FlgG